jgi:hypothetical protein
LSKSGNKRKINRENRLNYNIGDFLVVKSGMINLLLLDMYDAPFLIAKLIGVDENNRLTVEWYSNTGKTTQYGKGAFTVDKENGENVTALITQPCVALEFKALTKAGRIPQPVLEEIDKNQSINWNLN